MGIIQEIELWQSSKHCNFCNLCSTMASRDGATVDGTDGSDFAHREREVSQYYTSAKNKGRLSLTQWFHIFVALVLTAKLSPAILDNFDIFVLALEEQNIPKPLTWEWIWLAGTIGIVLFGLYAMKTSKATNIKIYMTLVFFLGFLPVGWCMVLNFSDMEGIACIHSMVHFCHRGLKCTCV